MPALVASSYPARLRDAGYHTGFVGKLGVRMPEGATDAMFDTFVPLRPPYLAPREDGEVRHLTDVTADRAFEDDELRTLVRSLRKLEDLLAQREALYDVSADPREAPSYGVPGDE